MTPSPMPAIVNMSTVARLNMLFFLSLLQQVTNFSQQLNLGWGFGWRSVLLVQQALLHSVDHPYQQEDDPSNQQELGHGLQKVAVGDLGCANLEREHTEIEPLGENPR